MCRYGDGHGPTWIFPEVVTLGSWELGKLADWTFGIPEVKLQVTNEIIKGIN